MFKRRRIKDEREQFVSLPAWCELLSEVDVDMDELKVIPFQKGEHLFTGAVASCLVFVLDFEVQVSKEWKRYIALFHSGMDRLIDSAEDDSEISESESESETESETDEDSDLETESELEEVEEGQNYEEQQAHLRIFLTESLKRIGSLNLKEIEGVRLNALSVYGGQRPDDNTEDERVEEYKGLFRLLRDDVFRKSFYDFLSRGERDDLSLSIEDKPLTLQLSPYLSVFNGEELGITVTVEVENDSVSTKIYEEADEVGVFFPPINATDLVNVVLESSEKLLREQEERLAQRRLNTGYRKRIPR